MPPQQTGKPPAVGEDVTSLMPAVGGDVTALMGGPKTTNEPSVIFPQALPNIPQIFKNLVIGAAKGTGSRAADLAKFTMNPASTGITPFDMAKEAWQPEGMAQTIGSFAPDVALGYGTGLGAARTAASAPGALAPRLERTAEKMWDKASNRPLAEISGNPGLSREVLERKIGPMTQPNAVKQAELRASKLPGVIDTRTPAVQEVEPVKLFDESGKAFDVGGVEGKPGTGFYAQPTKPREAAFRTTQASYNQARNRRSIPIFGTQIPNPIPKGTAAQKLFNNASALQSAVPGTAVGFAELLSRLFNSGGDNR